MAIAESRIAVTLREGARGGALAAASASGALLGFGLRKGTTARPFNAFAALLLGNRARGVWTFDPSVSFVGMAVLVGGCLLVGIMLGAIAAPMRTRRPRLVAFAVALITAAIGLAVLVARAPDLVGVAPVGALSLSQGIVLAVVASVGFASGIGLAR
ncbi:MAG: hypothetical protein HOQ09_13270 [Gemmatimonadaceae bacterium]|nr:hypothetical protein [Gemmatimonadaceae bacterium]